LRSKTWNKGNTERSRIDQAKSPASNKTINNASPPVVYVSVPIDHVVVADSPGRVVAGVSGSD
jgi:hypothetical protein